jgi:hypothetical protein
MVPGMNRICDIGFVSILILASVSYALMKLAPKPMRRRVSGALARLLIRVPTLHGVARRLEAAAQETSAGCGGCASCEPETQTKAPSEVHVPLAAIGRRRS